MNSQQREDLQADLQVENELLAECQSSLDFLVSPNYDPSKNPDHDFRDADIESLSAEIYLIKGRIARIKKSLAEK